MGKLILVRGLPGSGKSSFAYAFIGGSETVSADDYFTDAQGRYHFDPTQLPHAHKECQDRAKRRLKGGECAAVANTFSCRWEMQPYFDMARETDSVVFVVDLFDGGLTDEELKERNSHGVPLDGIKAMRDRWEHDWKVGDPRPPWER